MTGPQLAFSRRIDRPLAMSLEAMGSWRPGRAPLSGRCALVEVPGRAMCYRLGLRTRRIGRPVPMELSVTAWSPGATHLELAPLRAVRPGRRYFARARALLDDATSALVGVETAPRGTRPSA